MLARLAQEPASAAIYNPQTGLTETTYAAGGGMWTDPSGRIIATIMPGGYVVQGTEPFRPPFAGAFSVPLTQSFSLYPVLWIGIAGAGVLLLLFSTRGRR